MSSSSPGFEDYDQVQWDAFADVPVNVSETAQEPLYCLANSFQLTGDQRNQQFLPLNTGQSNVDPYVRYDFKMVNPSPVTTKSILARCPTHNDDTVVCNVDYVKREREIKKAVCNHPPPIANPHT
jgi:hypothetical protein